jgi:hypothetical protein
LKEDFGVSIADLAAVNVHHVLALQAVSPDRLILIFCTRPERDAYLVAARLVFSGGTVAQATSLRVA